MLAVELKTTYIADLVFLIFVIIFMLVYARKGFINVFFSFISSVIAVIVAVLFAARLQTVSGGLFGFEGACGGWIGNGLSKITPFDMDISAEGIEAQISALALPAFIKEAVLAEIVAIAPEVASGTLLGQYVGVVLSQYLVLFICGAALFFGVKLVMLILRKAFTALAERIGFFRKINRLGGLLVGFVTSVIIVCALLAVVALIPNETLHAFFEETIILRELYHNNPVHLLLASFVQ
jgi:uncharacterized membrane protein required for colicin V production